MDLVSEAPSAGDTRVLAKSAEQLPVIDTPEFDALCDEAFRRVADKYAWIAQLQGIVLRHNPLRMAAYKDFVFNRLAKADYGFHYIDQRGKRRFWYPSFNEAFGLTMEGELDCGIVVAERVEFLPGQPEITHDADGCRVLNLWKSPPWKIGDSLSEPTIFTDHLRYLFDEDEAVVTHVLDYLAHMLQKPAERIGHALLITSEAKGIGKSTLGTIARRLVGERNSRVAQTKDLKGQFDGWLMGVLLVQIDEVYEAGNWDLSNKLKPIITEPTTSANIKYGPQLEIKNYARLLLFSNHSAPINIEEGDRRYFVVNSSAKPRDDDYYIELNRYIDSDAGMNEIYSFLMRRDLSEFNPYRRPFMTTAKEAVIAESGNPLHSYIGNAVASGHFRRSLGEIFSLDQLQRLLQHDGYGQHGKNLRELSKALAEAGVTSIRPRVEGKKVRMFQLPPGEEEFGADTCTDF